MLLNHVQTKHAHTHPLCSAAFILDPNSMLLLIFYSDCDACFTKKSRENHFDIFLSMTVPFFHLFFCFRDITFRAAECDLMLIN